ncbi:MAG: hypothetical protein ACTSYQ_02210 [Candidatus Odinarchaeia archaeon]
MEKINLWLLIIVTLILAMFNFIKIPVLASTAQENEYKIPDHLYFPNHQEGVELFHHVFWFRFGYGNISYAEFPVAVRFAEDNSLYYFAWAYGAPLKTLYNPPFINMTMTPIHCVMGEENGSNIVFEDHGWGRVIQAPEGYDVGIVMYGSMPKANITFPYYIGVMLDNITVYSYTGGKIALEPTYNVTLALHIVNLTSGELTPPSTVRRTCPAG